MRGAHCDPGIENLLFSFWAGGKISPLQEVHKSGIILVMIFNLYIYKTEMSVCLFIMFGKGEGGGLPRETGRVDRKEAFL